MYVFSLPQVRTGLLESPWAGPAGSITAHCHLPYWSDDVALSGVDLFLGGYRIVKDSIVTLVGMLPRGFGLCDGIPESFFCSLSLGFALTFKARNGFM